MKVCKLAGLLGLDYKDCTDTSVTFIKPKTSERVVIILIDGGFKLSVDNSEHNSITELVGHYHIIRGYYD